MSKASETIDGATFEVRTRDLRFTKASATTAVAESSPSVTPASGLVGILTAGEWGEWVDHIWLTENRHVDWTELIEAVQANARRCPVSAIGTEAPSTHGAKHWTHRMPDRVARGERHYRAKLTAGDVRVIRHLAERGYPKTHIALAAGIHYRHCLDIIAGRKWKHLPAADGGRP